MSSDTYVRCIDILLVEDNPGVVRLTKETKKNSKIHNTVNVVTNGDEALAYLYRRDKYLNAVRPDLIFLDLNLPKKGAKRYRPKFKEDPELKAHSDCHSYKFESRGGHPEDLQPAC